MKGEIDCVLLACTELSIVYGSTTSIDGLSVIDTSTEYAKATIEFARARESGSDRQF